METFWMYSYYIQSLLNGLFTASAEEGCDLLFAMNPSSIHGTGELDKPPGAYDAVVLILPPRESRVASRLARGRVPTIIIGQRATFDIPHVTADDTVGATAAMQYLFELGHRRVGHIAGPLQHDDALDRLSAYSTFGHANGLAMPDRWIGMGDYSFENVRDIAREILSLSDRPTAIFAANDLMALAVLEAAHHFGIRVPEELSVVGFDDSQDAHRADPPLTTVLQPTEEVARRCIQSLMQSLATGQPPENILLETTLVIRRSTAPPPSIALR